MHAKVFTFTLMCTAFFLFYFAKTTWNFRKPGDETARRAKCWRKPRARPHSTRPVTVIWHTHYQTFSYWFLDSCERSSMHTAKPFYTTPRVSSTDLYWSDRDGAQRGGGRICKRGRLWKSFLKAVWEFQKRHEGKGSEPVYGEDTLRLWYGWDVSEEEKKIAVYMCICNAK